MRQLLPSKMTGILSLIVAAFSFSVSNMCIKFLSPELPLTQIIFMRYLGSFIFALLIWRSIRFSLKSSNYKLLILHSVLGVSANFLFWLALRLDTSLSNATVLAFTYPIFGALFSHWIFNEKLTPVQLITVLFSFIGVYFVLNPTFLTITPGEMCATTVGIILGVALNLLRMLGTQNNIFIIFLFVQIAGLVGFFIPGISNFHRLLAPDFYIMFIIILFSIIGPLAMIIGYKQCSVSEGGTLQEIEIIFATLWGMILFHEKPTLNFIFGGMIIIACGIYLTQSHRNNTNTAR